MASTAGLPFSYPPGSKAYEGQKAYHTRLVVENNDFLVTDERLIDGKNLGELIWKNNRVKHADKLPGHPGKAFVLEHVLKTNREE